MYTRWLNPPSGSFFLFGPRGTGKSTWIRARFAEAACYDLLDTSEALRLGKAPHALYAELATLDAGATAVIDEVQKVPALLDQVHRLIEEKRLRFVLSGSSARKLRRGGRHHPLTGFNFTFPTPAPLSAFRAGAGTPFPPWCDERAAHGHRGTKTSQRR